ncbi:hypothetical protein [Loigolactobacillus binensis]|uniref:DUF4352 domain-containing protein n=1 Tax=Loigolactobacillus binensis TaxID=2559922 RepID=A0ABW3EAN2_9LACO|nr:hypothetical protein [Loigolactobacillus binensis]
MNTRLSYQPDSYKAYITRWNLLCLLGMLFGSWIIDLSLLHAYNLLQLLLAILFFWTLLGIVLIRIFWVHHSLAQANYQIAAINQQQTGVWLHLNTQEIYVALTWLTISEAPKVVTLRFKHALRFDHHGQPHPLPDGKLVLARRLFADTDLESFIAALYTIKRGKTVAINKKYSPQPARPIIHLPKRTWFGLGGTILLSLLLITLQANHVSQKRQARENARYIQVNYQPGKRIHAHNMNVTINNAYRATSENNHAVVILNCRVAATNDQDYSLIGSDDFELYKKWSLRAKNNEDSYDSGVGHSYAAILIDHKPKQVINTLDAGFDLTEMPSESLTFNIVLKLPQTNKFDFFFNDADLVVHMKKSDLAVIK